MEIFPNNILKHKKIDQINNLFKIDKKQIQELYMDIILLIFPINMIDNNNL